MKERVLSAVYVLILLLIILDFTVIYIKMQEETTEDYEEPPVQDTFVNEQQFYFGSNGYLSKIFSEEDKQDLRLAFHRDEEDVYSFLQGPRSWGEGIPWSGEWCTFNIEGNPFGGFGCGLCCLANIYDTFTPYEVSPLDMFEYALSVTDYYPTGKAGAIDWEYMNQTLKCCGFSSGLYRKPRSYEEFKEQIADTDSAIVLVSSNNDDTFWQDTPGHYVNIWLYQEEDETVFLTEPGNPEKNRSRVPLRYIYDALKTISHYQYLAVYDYLEERNQWKGNGIDDNWNRPAD